MSYLADVIEQAFVGRPDLMDYTSTKGSLVSFTRALSNQILTEKQIRVNAIW